METKICLDTDFLVNFLRNKEEEVEFIRVHEGNTHLAVSMVTLFELYYGAYKSNVPHNVLQVEELQKRLILLHLSHEAVKKAGDVLATLERKGTAIEFRDLFIGVIAQTEGFSIKTYNKKHFLRIPGLTVV